MIFVYVHLFYTCLFLKFVSHALSFGSKLRIFATKVLNINRLGQLTHTGKF